MYAAPHVRLHNIDFDQLSASSEELARNAGAVVEGYVHGREGQRKLAQRRSSSILRWLELALAEFGLQTGLELRASRRGRVAPPLDEQHKQAIAGSAHVV